MISNINLYFDKLTKRLLFDSEWMDFDFMLSQR
jgi:hypothetical protein